jgi:hypothetical protein
MEGEEEPQFHGSGKGREKEKKCMKRKEKNNRERVSKHYHHHSPIGQLGLCLWTILLFPHSVKSRNFELFIKFI